MLKVVPVYFNIIYYLGQNIGQLFPPPQWLDLTAEFPNTLNNMSPIIGKNQKPNFKPSTTPLQITQPHIPYLFPYLFPGTFTKLLSLRIHY
jgi:hypothetical protein